MRPSSIKILVAAAVLLIIAMAGFLASTATGAPPMTAERAQRFLNQGKSALQRGDIDAIFSLFSKDATIFGRTPAGFRQIVEQAIRELNGTPLNVTFSKIEVRPEGERTLVSVNLDVFQRLPRADVSYYRPRVHMVLRKERMPRILGLGSEEEWRIVQLDSEESLDLPPP